MLKVLMQRPKQMVFSFLLLSAYYQNNKSIIVSEIFNIAIITAIIDVINAMSQSLNFFIDTSLLNPFFNWDFCCFCNLLHSS
jgi:hypothetical protein